MNLINLVTLSKGYRFQLSGSLSKLITTLNSSLPNTGNPVIRDLDKSHHIPFMLGNTYLTLSFFYIVISPSGFFSMFKPLNSIGELRVLHSFPSSNEPKREIDSVNRGHKLNRLVCHKLTSSLIPLIITDNTWSLSLSLISNLNFPILVDNEDLFYKPISSHTYLKEMIKKKDLTKINLPSSLHRLLTHDNFNLTPLKR